MNKICIKDINFSYEDKVIFTNFNLTLENGLTFLIGNNGSGKTTLFNILLYKLPCIRNILIDNVELTKNNKDMFFLNIDYVNSLKGKVSNIIDINDKTKKVITYLDLNTYLDEDYTTLPIGIKIKICIAIILIKDYSKIFIDDILCWLTKVDRNKILKKFKTLAKKKIILITTNNLEDTINANRLILIKDGKIILDDIPLNFYNNEKIIKECGLILPFMVDLSLNLKLYNMIDNIYLDMEKLVDDIWK